MSGRGGIRSLRSFMLGITNTTYWCSPRSVTADRRGGLSNGRTGMGSKWRRLDGRIAII